MLCTYDHTIQNVQLLESYGFFHIMFQNSRRNEKLIFCTIFNTYNEKVIKLRNFLLFFLLLIIN